MNKSKTSLGPFNLGQKQYLINNVLEWSKKYQKLLIIIKVKSGNNLKGHNLPQTFCLTKLIHKGPLIDMHFRCVFWHRGVWLTVSMTSLRLFLHMRIKPGNKNNIWKYTSADK